MNQTEREIHQIFDRGAQALEKVFRPGKAVHLAIDWQKLYCDPRFPFNPAADLRLTQKIVRALARMNETVQALRPLMPTCWIYQDIALRYSNLPDKRIMRGLEPAQIKQKLNELRAEGRQLCGDIRPGDQVFCKQEYYDAYRSAELLRYLGESKIFVHLLSGLTRTCCVRETERGGNARGYSLFVMEDLTVDNFAPDDPLYLKLCQDAQRRGTHCVRSEDVKAIAAKFQP